MTLADEPVNVLVTIGQENDPALLESVLATARVQRFIPQAEVLPYCAAVIHPAGAGTMLGVLSHECHPSRCPRGGQLRQRHQDGLPLTLGTENRATSLFR